MGCALAPAEPHQVASFILPPLQHGVLHDYATRIEARLGAGESAFWLIDDAKLALDSRLALVDHAESSLDVQYFIWEDGFSSRLLTRRLIAAADRGVRVRLLLDDLTLMRRDWEYVALDRHPLVEVRTFNPWTGRSRAQRLFEFIFKHDDLNHRMHLKTMVADGHFAMIGGRNVGDRYFGVYDVFVQNDLDVMTAGPLVADVAQSFDVFWNHGEAYPVNLVARRRHRDATLEEFTEYIETVYRRGRDKLHMYPLERADWRGLLDELSRNFLAGHGVLSYDSPEFDVAQPAQLYEVFKQQLKGARERVLMSTAYLIPDPELMDLIEELVARGVRVVILTNSLATNNHTIAHTGYRRWRRRLLDAGVELYELRADAASKSLYSLPPTDAGWLGLHTKAVVVDDRSSFIGSPNVDPRSMIVNMEIGFFIDSVELAAELTALLERDLDPENSWRVSMDEEGWLEWRNGDESLTRQPAKSLKQRVVEFFLNLLPLKNQA